jgi:hypothetical protein
MSNVTVLENRGETRTMQSGTDEAQEDPTAMEYQGVVIADSPEDVDYEDMAPKAATAAMFNRPRDDRPKTFLFRLTHTGIREGEDIAAEVRLVNLTDRALLSQVPAEVRQIVQKLFFSGTANQRGTPKKETSERRMDNQLKRLKEVGYAYGVAGFVNPKLVMRPEDVKDPEKETWVGNIELADLTEFSRICEGDDQLAKRRLESFSE